MSIWVRGSREEDGEAFARLHERCWRISYAGIADPAWVVERPLAERVAEWQRFAGGAGLPMWTATVDYGGEVVGLVAAGASRDEGASDRIGEVAALYVDPEWQGRGAGSALLERAVFELRVQFFHRATLWTLEGSAQSRGFYEKHGWAFDGTTKDGGRTGARHVRYARAL